MVYLRKVIQVIDQKILSSSGVDSFEEIIKILFLKMFDEIENNNNFFSSQNFSKANEILKKANLKWPGVIKEKNFKTKDKALRESLNEIKNLNIFATDSSAFDTVIEYLLPYTHRGTRGQFMTPRNVIAEIIKMLKPKENETLIDPACGSGGFLEYSILFQKNNRESYAKTNIAGIDYDDRMARIAQLVCLKNSGEECKIFHTNSLNKNITQKFDIVVSNPPYGGIITEDSILKKFTLSKDKNGNHKKTPRHLLFIEKCIQLAKPGGRIALILPQGVLNNSKMKNVHNFIFNTCRLMAVISLPQSTFMPHTNVKTSIVIFEKINKVISNDYKVFMDISNKSGKDKKGKTVLKNGQIVHDLDSIRLKFNKFKEKENIVW